MEPATTPTTDALPTLSAIEARILGCLIEKQATTPENYPLTDNALVRACNQKTARDPVLELQHGAGAMPCASWRIAGWCSPTMAHARSVTSSVLQRCIRSPQSSRHCWH